MARLVELGPLTHPGNHLLVIVVGGVGQHLQEFGVAGGAATVLRWAAALAVAATRLGLTGAQDIDVVVPAVAEVVQVAKPGRQLGQPHPGLVVFVAVELHVRHAVADLADVGADVGGDHELVQVAVGPADRDLQQVVQLGQRARGGHIQHPQHGRGHLPQRDSQPDRAHRPTLVQLSRAPTAATTPPAVLARGVRMS